MPVDVGDTRLHVEERGAGDLALIALHGGPGLDHTIFGHWLDPEDGEYRLLLVDEREPDAYRAALRRFLARV
jgi:pimeloyl-ACP methyl ester carboxylesterase